MAYTTEQLRQLAQLSVDGEFNRHSIDPFCQTCPGITEAEGYAAQEMRMAMVEQMGHRRVGYKLGGTSLAKVNQLKSTIYSDPNAVVPTSVITYGRLFDYMAIPEDGDLVFSTRLHPKVEPEFCFVMGEDIKGANVTAADVIMATEKVVPSFEVIDSRFRNFKIGWRYDALVDNTSSAAYKIGIGGVDPKKVDLNDIGMKLMYNGEYTGFGAGASIMGHPARAVAELVHALSAVDKGLKKGDIILSGAITASTPVKVGDTIRADFGAMGHVEMKVV